MMPPIRPPSVSVVIPAYNAAWCIRRALDSVLAQDYTDLEIIVVNDGSTDHTASVLAEFGDEIEIVDKENGGLSSARNAGLRFARGRYVAFLDADDWWLPEKLRRQVNLIETTPDIGFCSTAARVEDPAGRLLNIWQCPSSDQTLLATLFCQNAAVAGSASGVLAKRDLLLRAGGFDTSLKSLEDIDMWMRLAACAGFACIAEPLTVIFKHPNSMSRNLQVMRDSALIVMRKNRLLLPRELQGGFWHAAMAGIHADYAKWRYRNGERASALLEVLHVLLRAPIRRGRLGLGLLRDILLGRPI